MRRSSKKLSTFTNVSPLKQSAKVQTRIACNFPIMIKGFNALGERYEELALVENISRRGICFRSGQILIPGMLLTIYRSAEDHTAIAFCEVVWASSAKDKFKRIGAQLLGDNNNWMDYLSHDLVLLQEPTVTRPSASVAVH